MRNHTDTQLVSDVNLLGAVSWRRWPRPEVIEAGAVLFREGSAGQRGVLDRRRLDQAGRTSSGRRSASRCGDAGAAPRPKPARTVHRQPSAGSTRSARLRWRRRACTGSRRRISRAAGRSGVHGKRASGDEPRAAGRARGLHARLPARSRAAARDAAVELRAGDGGDGRVRAGRAAARHRHARISRRCCASRPPR